MSPAAPVGHAPSTSDAWARQVVEEGEDGQLADGVGILAGERPRAGVTAALDARRLAAKSCAASSRTAASVRASRSAYRLHPHLESRRLGLGGGERALQPGGGDRIGVDDATGQERGSQEGDDGGRADDEPVVPGALEDEPQAGEQPGHERRAVARHPFDGYPTLHPRASLIIRASVPSLGGRLAVQSMPDAHRM